MSTGSSPSIGSNTASLPSPRTSRYLGSVSQFPNTALPPPSSNSIPVLVSRSVTSSNSLVGQLLNASGNAATAGATPYGMIVSAASDNAVENEQTATTEQREQQAATLGRKAGGIASGLMSGVMPLQDMRRHSHPSAAAEKVPTTLKIPHVSGYTDLSPIYAIVCCCAPFCGEKNYVTKCDRIIFMYSERDHHIPENP